MTLEALQYLVTDLALKHNLVNCAMSGPSIYAINPEDIKEYPLIFVSPTGTHTIKENTTRYSLTFFYMDRLFEDSSNEETINSAGIETLRNLKLQLSKIEVVTDIQEDADIRLFTETERMADRVAGAYMTIWIETLNPTTCPQFFDELGFYLGSYFPTDGLEAVLDNLASKEWVNRLIASLSVSGITPEEFERIMGDYVLRKNFATINGSTITNRERFNLVEQGEYSEQIQQILQAISANTQDITDITQNLTAVTENITVLSGDTTEIENNITELSASTQEEIQNIYQTISGITPEGYETLQEQVSANTEDIAELKTAVSGINETIEIQNSAITGINETLVVLSAQTSANTAQISDLSGFTNESVSSLTHEIEVLSEAISAATPADYDAVKQQVSANTEDIAELSGLTADLSGITTGISSDLQALSAYTETISDWVFYTTGYAGPQNVRNSDDLVDFVQSLGSEFAKARIFINEIDPRQWLEYHVFRVTGDTVYVWAVYNRNTNYIEVKHGSFTKGVSPSQSDFVYFSINPGDVSRSISNLQVQVAANTNSINAMNGQVTGLTSDLAALSAFTETLTGGTRDFVLDAAAIYNMTTAQRTELWDLAEQKYLDGYNLYMKGYDIGYDVIIPLVKYYPTTSYEEFDFGGIVVHSSNKFYDVRFYRNGTLDHVGAGGDFEQQAIYTLPTASASTKGGVKVGTGLSMSGQVMNADVASNDVHNIVSLTQSAYDALATKDPNTLYIIKPLY